MNILIAGDSYAADWSAKNTDYPGWVALLSQYFSCKNVAQAGIGEYKIYQQLIRERLDSYDFVIVCNTSPYRVHTVQHPFHSHTSLHKDADLIFSDIENYVLNNNNVSDQTQSAYRFFLDHFDTAYYNLIYQLLRDKIRNHVSHKDYLFVDFFSDIYFSSDEKRLDLSDIPIASPGTVNHMNAEANQTVADILREKIYAQIKR